jgi:hypothetical protein
MNESRGTPQEARLLEVASAFLYPPTPELWPAVRVELGRRSLAAPAARRRLALALAGVAIAVVLVLFALPSARAAVYRVLQLGVVRIFLEQETATPSVTVVPAATLAATSTPLLRAPLDLQGRTDMETARRALGEAIRLPTYPEPWGDPDLVFLQSIDGPLAVLVWLDPADPARAELALHVLGPNTFAGKDGARLIEATRVNGREALWLVGAHSLLLRSGQTAYRTLVTGNVLLWAEGALTYRLETDRTMQEAVRIAESLR